MSNKLFALLVSSIALAASGCTIARPAVPTTVEDSLLLGLKDYARIPIGVAVQPKLLQTEPKYRDIVLKEFSSISTENALKMDVVQPFRGTFDFSQADALLEFAEAHGIRFRAHPLVWHRQLPNWLNEAARDDVEAILSSHISTLASRYRSRVAAWDVVNEAFLSTGAYRNSIWYRGLGTEYIAKAFLLARAADPEAQLFYNDYDIERPGAKFDAVYDMLVRLLAAGVPIDGVGLQTHLRPGYEITEEELTEVVSQLSTLGLQIEITELDLALTLPSDEAARTRAGEQYAMIARVCSRFASCTGITLWGVSDRHSWVPNELPGRGEATLFDLEYLPKAAYQSFKRALMEHSSTPDN